MADTASVSHTDLEGRRKKLKKQRRKKIIQTVWRSLTLVSLTSGLLWATVQPTWLLKTEEDVKVSGNQLLSSDKIQSLLPLSYPQSIWKIEPSRIAQSLQKQPLIANVSVTRRLFPPGLTVEVSERVPVAVARKTKSDSGNTLLLLDATGVLISAETNDLKIARGLLPNLKVIGSPEQYRQFWSQLYQAVSSSPVKITEIDCQDLTNIILTTEIGRVYLGAPGPQLPDQIKVLAQMRRLPTKVNTNKIQYIDLRNPDSPTIQIRS
ncbi:polypeptide-transport-associated domain-containing protein FtsQ-type [Calothrix sp. NIES-4071]|nr:polypeptide-transport-associated domain-containing protein FtsQ-type [Calothrix sp. NIES-4071]BAZ62992.1 polypeptide-transport-associated domain-containing protein FtsQ-type [Calothrix sp. NIES-4105]